MHMELVFKIFVIIELYLNFFSFHIHGMKVLAYIINKACMGACRKNTNKGHMVWLQVIVLHLSIKTHSLLPTSLNGISHNHFIPWDHIVAKHFIKYFTRIIYNPTFGTHVYKCTCHKYIMLKSTFNFVAMDMFPITQGSQACKGWENTCEYVRVFLMSILCISWNSFRDSSKKPFFTNFAIIALHGNISFWGIFLKSLKASSTYPICVNLAIIAILEISSCYGIFSNNSKASSRYPAYIL